MEGCMPVICCRSAAAREKDGVKAGGQLVLMLPGVQGGQPQLGMHAAQNVMLKVLVGLQPRSGNLHNSSRHHWPGYSHLAALADTSAHKDDMAAGD